MIALSCYDCGTLAIAGGDLPCSRHATNEEKKEAARRISMLALQANPLLEHIRKAKGQRYKP